MRAVQSLASDHFRLLGERGASDPPLLSAGKNTNWDTCLEVLGWIVDTESLTVTLPSPKRLKLRVLLSEWPPSRVSASAKQVSQLVGFLMHVSFAFRPGSFFVQRMLASVGMPRITAGADYACRMVNPGLRVALGPEFHGNLEFWRCCQRGAGRAGGELIGSDVSPPRESCQAYSVFGRFENRYRGFLSRDWGVLEVRP